jgi:hypothetical protein
MMSTTNYITLLRQQVATGRAESTGYAAVQWSKLMVVLAA